MAFRWNPLDVNGNRRRLILDAAAPPHGFRPVRFNLPHRGTQVGLPQIRLNCFLA